jgi:hypothetical protein
MLLFAFRDGVGIEPRVVFRSNRVWQCYCPVPIINPWVPAHIAEQETIDLAKIITCLCQESYLVDWP